ncbi:MAG: porphobilinogen synthase, partial [Thermoleophilia bacterium]|nr:porphobilinogen synthase [Thermoleophilia bacterium]
MAFPATRLRRMRGSRGIRDLVREVDVTPAHLIQPLFVLPGDQPDEPVESMPGVSRLSVDRTVEEARDLYGLGVPAVLLFGLPEDKDDEGSGAWDPDGAVQRAVTAIKADTPDLTVITDVCLCAYTTHGHCGVLDRDGEVDNDETLGLLARTAISHAAAGADIVAPSDMMDGRVGALRQALDEDDFANTAIMAYSAKYASAFYGPFRDAADSTPARQTGIASDRRGYQ